ncbi:unnamed protein product [Microthlaspi erraticum]|uniref:Uncharacterized protein n=1 Tax=Microthlaspi erraticum TaxID=1685480 RepID=A0A6D2KW74_9BRAS|nr:unnamed protein product [Microthlaspi erraticum]
MQHKEECWRVNDMIMASAKVKEHGPKLEPDGVKDLELEPVEQLEREGRKLVAEDELEPELVAEEALAAPMELVTHYRVNLELKWRQPDPKPPWFLIQAQEISKWACVSFVLFFPCQVLSQWVFLTRSLNQQLNQSSIKPDARLQQDPKGHVFTVRCVSSQPRRINKRNYFEIVLSSIPEHLKE